MEDATVRLVRADGAYAFPASFTLIAAANPCPCGYNGDDHHPCHCTPSQVERYERRIGGPLLDRMDIRLRVDPENPDRMLESRANEPSHVIAKRVAEARSFAAKAHGPLHALTGHDLLAAINPETTGSRTIREIAMSTSLSGRALTRLLRVSRTIADLELSIEVTADHVDEAFSLRGNEGAAMPV
jgi:magnesium chelatase family protein